MWFLALLICTLITAVAVFYIDVPIAHHVYGIFGPAKSLGAGFSSAVLLGAEAAVALGLVIVRVTRG
jgi:hypothetical protein